MIKITQAQVTEAVSNIFAGELQADGNRTTYLKLLITEAQAVLAGKGKPVEDQLAAVALAHEQFYEIVLELAEGTVPRGTKDRGALVNSRSNFARTSASVLRRYVRGGHDLATIKPDKTSKRAMEKAVPARPALKSSARRLRNIAEVQAAKLRGTLAMLIETDREAAIDALQQALSEMTSQLVSLGVTATKDPEIARNEGRPLLVDKHLFTPLDRVGRPLSVTH